MPLLFSPASRARFLSALNTVFWSVLSCPAGRRVKADFRYSKSEHMEPVVETLSAHLRLTAGSLSSITAVGHD